MDKEIRMTGEVAWIQFVKWVTPERLTTITTFIYMLFTGWLIRETRKWRKLQESPQLDIFVKRSEEWWSELDLIIKNNWYGWAYDIRLESDKNFNLFDNEDKYTLQNLWYFKNGISFLPPKGERESFFTYMTTKYEEKIKRRIGIKAFYKDKYWIKKKDVFVIDLSEFEDTLHPQQPPIYKISENIEKFQKDFNHISTWFYKLHIITQTKEEKKIEDKKHYEECRKNIELLEDKKCK